jgi:hypothetical protein
MTATSVADSRGLLAGELVDLLIEAVVLPSGPVARAEVICELLNELCDAVHWLHGAVSVPDESLAAESASLRHLVVAAQDHELRMRALGIDALEDGGER